MSHGLIKYSDILNHSLNEVVQQIIDAPKLKYGDIKLSDLVIQSRIEDLKLSEYYSPQFFGMGVYVFFDDENPIYVGKAANFLHRLSSHRFIDPRPNWGWNALLKKICISRLGILDSHTVEDYWNALSIMEEFKVVRVLANDDFSSNQLSKLERIIMKGIHHNHTSLLNGNIGKVHRAFMENSLGNILN